MFLKKIKEEIGYLRKIPKILFKIILFFLIFGVFVTLFGFIWVLIMDEKDLKKYDAIETIVIIAIPLLLSVSIYNFLIHKYKK